MWPVKLLDTAPAIFLLIAGKLAWRKQSTKHVVRKARRTRSLYSPSSQRETSHTIGDHRGQRTGLRSRAVGSKVKN